MKKLINIGLFFLSLHLFTVHSKLIYHLNPDKLKDVTFSFINLTDEPTVLSLVISITYSIITVTLIKVLKHWKYYIYSIIVFAILDGAGMTIYYMVPEEFSLIGSVYYGIYTFYIIICLGFSEKNKIKTVVTDIDNEIMILYGMSYKVPEIAKKTGLSQSSVQTIINRNES